MILRLLTINRILYDTWAVYHNLLSTTTTFYMVTISMNEERVPVLVAVINKKPTVSAHILTGKILT